MQDNWYWKNLIIERGDFMVIIIALLVFSILIIVHEFGHYIVAKKSGVLVQEFAIGMGPKLIGKQVGETLYTIRLFPIGGYCKMLGEDDDSNDERAFGNKSVFKRMLIVVAGAFMNFVLAFLTVFVITSVKGFNVPIISELTPNYPAQEAGLQTGDKIIEINNQKIRIYDDLKMIMAQNKGEDVNLVIKRNGETLNYTITPKVSEENNGQILIGFVPKAKKGNIFESMHESYWTLWMYIKYTFIGFIQLITFQISPKEMGGPIYIVNMMGDAYSTGLKYSIWNAIESVASLAALISVNLGVLNLLPLPALDGGRFAFLLVEAVRRKPISAEKEGMVHFIGFVALMILAVFVAYNDLIRLF